MSIAEQSTESELLAEQVLAAQAGDREALGGLIERFERSVYNVAYRRLNNHAEAQELTQEVFVQALQKLDQLRDPASFGGWLRTIASRMALNRAVRRAPVISTEPATIEATYVEYQTPLGEVLHREERKQVRAGLRRLGELDRKTLVAFYVQGQSLIEMSDEFDSPIGTIKRRLHVARKRLARELATMAPN